MQRREAFLFELTTKPKYLKNTQKEIIVLLDGVIDNFNELKIELSLKANDQKGSSLNFISSILKVLKNFF